MSRIRAKGTGPELAVRRAASAAGLRYTLYRRDLPGTPDLVFSRPRVALFVNGCFWHRHEGCTFAYFPKSNAEFWQAKFMSNVARDNRASEDLRSMGWAPKTIWECETTDTNGLAEIVVTIVRNAAA